MATNPRRELESMEAAIRAKTPGAQPDQARSTAVDPTRSKNVVFDPAKGKLSVNIDDPLFEAINFMWKDRQQHGRLTYEGMMKHPAVSAALDGLLSFLKTYKPLVKPRAKKPSKVQKEIADYCQTQLERLGMDGDPTQSYEKLIDGLYGNALQFGFSLGEINTVVEKFNGKPMVQLSKIRVLPQASLDAGYQPLEEFGELNLFNDPRYRCFDMNEQGDVVAVHQYRRGSGRDEHVVSWRGEDLKRLLHAVHKGGDGNPYGESLLYSAFYAWADLYTLEQLENVFLDYGLPYLTASYKSDGRAAPDLHAEMLELVSQQDPSKRLLMGPDMAFGSVSASNPNFTEHIRDKKKELRSYINQALLMPQSLYSEAGDREADARNLISVFFKYIAPSYLTEIAGVINHQLLKRLVDANYSNVEFMDYPKVTFSTILDNDLRVAQGIITQIIPYMDEAKLGEALHSILPSFDPEWIPEDHKDSVEHQRPRRDSNDEPNNINGVTNPPPKKEQGETRERMDGQTENPSGRNTEV